MINCITAKEREMKQLLKEHEHLTRRLSVSLSSSRSGRRRSFYGSQIQLGDVFAKNGVKVVSADMPPFMQIHAVDCARKAHDSMEKFTSKSLALTLKKVHTNQLVHFSFSCSKCSIGLADFGRNLMGFTGRHGIVLWGRVLVHL